MRGRLRIEDVQGRQGKRRQRLVEREVTLEVNVQRVAAATGGGRLKAADDPCADQRASDLSRPPVKLAAA